MWTSGGFISHSCSLSSRLPERNSRLCPVTGLAILCTQLTGRILIWIHESIFKLDSRLRRFSLSLSHLCYHGVRQMENFSCPTHWTI